MNFDVLPLPFPARSVDAVFAELFPQADSEAAEVFVRQVRRAVQRGEEITLGSAAAPYAEPGSPRLLALLAPLLAGTPGSAVTLTVRSARILRELDLLVEIDRSHGVTAQVVLPSVDPELAERLEGPGPLPAERLRTVEGLASAGIATAVLCAPFQPQVHAREEVLRPLFEEAVAAGAFDIAAAPPRGFTPAADRAWRQLRLEHGLPRAVIGRT
jgi:DNA repair photolyase